MKRLVVGAIGLGTDNSGVIAPDLPAGASFVGYRPRPGAVYLVAVPDDSPLEASPPEKVAFWERAYGVSAAGWTMRPAPST